MTARDRLAALGCTLGISGGLILLGLGITWWRR